MDTPTGLHSLRALIVIPGAVNYFYNQCGRRLAEALAVLGVTADVRVLSEVPDRTYDWCAFTNIFETLHVLGGEAAGMDAVRAVIRRCGTVAACSMDCVATLWFQNLRSLCDRAGIDTILDLGLCDQTRDLLPSDRSRYRFVFSGLTPSERRLLDTPDGDDSRTVPWAFIGHYTALRAGLVDHLVQAVDPGGFVYLPRLAPFKEKNSPHLNQQQYEAVLRRTRYQVWCSHHEHFYMEPERFRASLLAGSVPVKVVPTRAEVPPQAPLQYLMLEPTDLAGRLTAGVFARVREQFRSDWRRFPMLSAGLARVLSRQMEHRRAAA